MFRNSARAGARLLATGAIGALLLVGLQAVPPATAAAAQAPCSSSVATNAEAKSMAARCGHDVEVMDARSEWSTLSAQPDGHMRLHTSIAAERTKVSGQWTSIDTTLVAAPEGVSMVAPAVQMVFSNGAKGQPLVKMQRDGHDLTFDVPFDLPTPVLSDNALEYPSVAPGVDLLVSVDPDGTGFSEVFRVASPEAAADPRIADLAFPITISPDLALTGTSDGGLVAADASGDPVFSSPMPQMWDSRADNQTPVVSANFTAADADGATDFGLTQGLQANRAARVHGPLSVDRSSDLKSRLALGKVKVTPDAGMLADPQTVWPVYIDPGVHADTGDRIAVADIGNKTWNFTGTEGMGRCGTTGSPMYCAHVFTERLVWQFYGLSGIGGSTVSNATLSVYGYHSYSCTPYPVEAWWTGAINSASTFQSISWLARLSSQSLAHKAACGNQRWIGFDVTGGAQQAANARADALAVGLKAADETSSTGWKRYQYDAKIDVTYDNPPNTPSGLQLVDGTVTKACGSTVSTSMPYMVATVHDPDPGDSPNMRVDITDTHTGGTQRVAGPTLANNSTWRIQPNIPLGDDPYTFTATAGDGVLLSGTSGACAFTVDTTPPNAPPGVVFAGNAYPKDTTSGGVGQTAQFTFSNGGVSDVVSYRYGIDDTAMPNSWASGQAAITFPAKSSGPHHIYVQSVDRAGWTGPRLDYQFSVAPNTTLGLWTFDDNPQTVMAADSSTVTVKHPLTLSQTMSRLKGGALGSGPYDTALQFKTASDSATATGPVVSANASFSVGAFVQLDDLTATQTAVSQDGVNVSGFELGYRSETDGGCPGGCWAFTINGADSAAAPNATTVVSTNHVAASQWVYLMGTFDAPSGEMSLYVCDDTAVPDPPVTATFGGSQWAAGGSFAVGRGRLAGSAHPLVGSVDVVRVMSGAVDNALVATFCGGSTVP